MDAVHHQVIRPHLHHRYEPLSQSHSLPYPEPTRDVVTSSRGGAVVAVVAAAAAAAAARQQRQHQPQEHKQEPSESQQQQLHRSRTSPRQAASIMDSSLSAPPAVGPQSHMMYHPPPTAPSSQHHHNQHHQPLQEQSTHSYNDLNGLSANQRPAFEQDRHHHQQQQQQQHQHQHQHQHQYYHSTRSEQATPQPNQPRSYSVDSGSSYPRGSQFTAEAQHRAGPVTHGRMEAQTHPIEHTGYHHSSYAMNEAHPNGSVHSSGLPLTSPQEQQHNHIPSPASHNYAMQASPIYPANPYTYGPSPTSQQQQQQQQQQLQPAARRKNVRASQACNQCRQRKQKCDELRPCSFCKESGLGDQCHYKDVQAPKHDRTMMDMVSKVDSILDIMQSLDARIAKIEKRSSTSHGESLIPPVSRSNSSNPGASATPMKSPGGSNFFHLSDIFPDDFTDGKRGRERKGGDHVLAIPPRHTTGAHKLLTHWHEVMNPLMKIQATEQLVVNSENYAFEAEDARGLLRVFGIGEGHDEGDGTQTSLTNGNGLEVSSPSLRASEGLWGATLTPSSNIDPKGNEDPFIGGVNADGSLSVDEQTVRRLFRSFLANIHILHPFLERKRITTLVDGFIRSYSPSGAAAKSPYAAASGLAATESALSGASLKRKRSAGLVNSPATSGGQDATGSSGPCQPIERSIRNALVLLVLALGKITEVKTPLSGPVRDGELYAPMPVGDSPSSQAAGTPPVAVKQSPVSSQFSIGGFMSPSMESSKIRTTSRQSSVVGISNHNDKELPLKSVDRIPGLAYYAKAAEILGNVQCGNDLSHVQAFLLAGLYMGQLGRVLESWSWINSACRACQYVVDKERDLLNSEKHKGETVAELKAETADSVSNSVRDVRKDLIVLAYWTCLQLESDILAELNLPPSGISAYEDDVPLPAGVSLDYTLSEYADPAEGTFGDVIVLLYYSAQIQLRKILNRAHTVLYGRNDHSSQQSGWKAFDPRDLEWSLAEWRRTLPKVLRWDDTDPPAGDINAARMRAKYYGARYIINRPFLRFAVLQMSKQPIDFLSEQDSPAEHREFMDHGIFGSDMNEERSQHPQDKRVDKQKILRAAKRCIDAAMKSTVSLDNVKGRLIVTNIWGTSHAQFGNMLVLAATYRSWLGPLIHKERLVFLLVRTIQHLSPLCQLSPALSYDHQILTNVLKNVQGDSSTPNVMMDSPAT